MSAPSLPSLASSTSYPAPRSIIASVVRMFRWSSTTRILGMSTRVSGVLELLGEVRSLAEFFDEAELGLEPIHVLFFRSEDLFQYLFARVVSLVATELNTIVQALHRTVLEADVTLQLLGHRLTDVKAV